jgi:ABC-type transporter Mla maintaining outer membrane lipid asymmetry ATPase subunit MlaF
MARLEIRDLRKSFGAVPVLHGIDLALESGEMLVIVGASGCGTGRSSSMAATSRRSIRPSATSPWCSRTTPSIRT